MGKRLGVTLVVLLALLGSGLTAPAQAGSAAGESARGKWKKSDYLPAPNFPASRLWIKVKGKPRAKKRVRLMVRGYNKPGTISPGSSIRYDYSLDIFVAARSVIKRCPRAFGTMRSIYIANHDKAAHLYSNVYLGHGGKFKKRLPYKNGGTRKVIHCAYVRWTIDDVVVSALKHNFRKPKQKAGKKR